MLSSRQVSQLLSGQSTTARKLYECVPIQEPWPVKQIMQVVKLANGGNVPDHKVISGCLNDMTDSGLLKRTGRDRYSRAPVRKLAMPAKDHNVPPEEPVPVKVWDIKPVYTPTVAIEEKPPVQEATVRSISVAPVLSAPKPVADQAVDPLITLLTHAESITTLAETLISMAKQIEELATQLETEREAVKKKTAKIEQLSELLKSLQSDE